MKNKLMVVMLSLIFFYNTSTYADDAQIQDENAGFADGRSASVFQISKGDTVNVLNPQTAQIRKAKRGEGLKDGEKVMTSGDQTVQLILADRSQVTLAPNSSMQVEKVHRLDGGGSTISLSYGVLRALVKKIYKSGDESFVVKAPNTVMGVRGTDFIVKVDSASATTSVHTIEGKVAVASTLSALSNPALSVIVGAGQVTRMLPGISKPEIPKTFDSSQLKTEMQNISVSSTNSSVTPTSTQSVRPTTELRGASPAINPGVSPPMVNKRFERGVGNGMDTSNLQQQSSTQRSQPALNAGETRAVNPQNLQGQVRSTTTLNQQNPASLQMIPKPTAATQGTQIVQPRPPALNQPMTQPPATTNTTTQAPRGTAP